MNKRLDVLLINPGSRSSVYQGLGKEFSAIEPPSLAAMFCTYLKRKGLGVEIIDAPAESLGPKEVADLATSLNPYLTVLVVYGFQPSASTQNMTCAGDTARAIKDLNPTQKIMMTGTHPAALPERTMREESIDFVCDREGPQTILLTANALRMGWKVFHGIPSLWYRASDGVTLLHNQPGELLDDLDEEMPGADWLALPMKKYRAHNWHAFESIGERSPYASMHTSLGCPYKCSFCCINAPFGKASYRMWSPASVAKEIDTLVYSHGVRHIKFVDEMFVLNRNHVMGICDEIIDGGLGDKLNIWAYARVDTVKDEFLDKMRAAGIRWLALGIESASKFVRDGVDKGRFQDDDILKVVRKIQAAGINVIGNFIFGLPDDTEASMRDTLQLALETRCEFANFYSAMAYPGSKLYTLAQEKKWPLPDDDGGPGWIGYSQHSHETMPLPTETLSAAQVLQFRDDAFHAYFRDPSYLYMIGAKFGPEAVTHLKRMVEYRLPRKILETAPAAHIGYGT